MPLNPFEFDAVINRKRRSVEESRKYKQDYLNRYGTLTPVTGISDLDTFTAEGFEEPIRVGDIDALESSSYAFDQPDRSEGKYHRQKETAARILGKPIEDVADEDVYALGQSATRSAPISKGQNVWVVPTGVGIHGRPISDIYDPDTLEDVFKGHKNPTYDSAYFAPWNRKKRIAEYRAKSTTRQEQPSFDEQGNPTLVQQKNGLYAYGSTRNIIASEIEDARQTEDIRQEALTKASVRDIHHPVIREVFNTIAGMSETAGHLIDSAKKAFVEEIYYGGGVSVQEKVDAYNSRNFKQWRKNAEGKKEYYDAEGNKAISMEEIGYIQLYNDHIQHGAPIPDELQEFIESERGQLLQHFFNDVVKTKQFVDAVDANKDKFFTKDKRDAHLFQKKLYSIAKEEGFSAALWEGVTKDLYASTALMVEALPFMVALSVPYVREATMVSMYSNAANEARREFIETYGRDPNEEEFNAIRTLSAMSVAFEKLGTAYIMKGMPVSFIKQLDKLPKTINYLTAPVRAFAIEYISGAGTELSTDLAGSLRFSDIDMAAVHTSGITEGLGGASMRGGAVLKQGLSRRRKLTDDLDTEAPADDRIDLNVKADLEPQEESTPTAEVNETTIDKQLDAISQFISKHKEGDAANAANVLNAAADNENVTPESVSKIKQILNTLPEETKPEDTTRVLHSLQQFVEKFQKGKEIENLEELAELEESADPAIQELVQGIQEVITSSQEWKALQTQVDTTSDTYTYSVGEPVSGKGVEEVYADITTGERSVAAYMKGLANDLLRGNIESAKKHLGNLRNFTGTQTKKLNTFYDATHTYNQLVDTALEQGMKNPAVRIEKIGASFTVMPTLEPVEDIIADKKELIEARNRGERTGVSNIMYYSGEMSDALIEQMEAENAYMSAALKVANKVNDVSTASSEVSSIRSNLQDIIARVSVEEKKKKEKPPKKRGESSATQAAQIITKGDLRKAVKVREDQSSDLDKTPVLAKNTLKDVLSSIPSETFEAALTAAKRKCK